MASELTLQGLHIQDLRDRYPGRHIEVIGRHPDFPPEVGQTWDRFFLSDPRLVHRILDLSPKVADQILQAVESHSHS